MTTTTPSGTTTIGNMGWSITTTTFPSRCQGESCQACCIILTKILKSHVGCIFTKLTPLLQCFIAIISFSFFYSVLVQPSLNHKSYIIVVHIYSVSANSSSYSNIARLVVNVSNWKINIST